VLTVQFFSTASFHAVEESLASKWWDARHRDSRVVAYPTIIEMRDYTL
jgi:hypothetical protein